MSRLCVMAEYSLIRSRRGQFQQRCRSRAQVGNFAKPERTPFPDSQGIGRTAKISLIGS